MPNLDVVPPEPPPGPPVPAQGLKDVFEKPLGGLVKQRIVAGEIEWKKLWVESRKGRKHLKSSPSRGVKQEGSGLGITEAPLTSAQK